MNNNLKIRKGLRNEAISVAIPVRRPVPIGVLILQLLFGK
jgi:hypothetical protein